MEQNTEINDIRAKLTEDEIIRLIKYFVQNSVIRHYYEHTDGYEPSVYISTTRLLSKLNLDVEIDEPDFSLKSVIMDVSLGNSENNRQLAARLNAIADEIKESILLKKIRDEL